MSDILFYAQFTETKVGKNSLTVTWDIEQITRADGTRAALVTGGANNVVVGRRGLYGYRLANADINTYDYVATAITADTGVDAQEIPALWTYWGEGTLVQADILSDATPFAGAFIDAAISTAVCDGPGAAPYEIIINDPGGNPLDGVNVWISTDLAGANIIFNGFTDTFGTVTPMLDAGNYFAWKQLAGYTFTNPQAFSAP